MASVPDFPRPYRLPAEVAADALPPQNIEAELCVLGGLLLDNSFIDDVAALLRAADFYRDAHQTLYEAILAIHGDGSPVDAILLLERLQGDARGLPAGLEQVVQDALSRPPHAANTEYYAQIVKQKAVARDLIDAAHEIIRDGHSNAHAADELVRRAEEGIFAIGEARATGDTADLSAALDEADELSARRASGEVSGVSSGLADLDDLLDGFQPGTLTIVGARPSMGKTALALNVLDHVAIRQGMTPFLVSLEMGRAEIAARLLQSRASLDGYKIKKPWLLTADDRDALEAASMALRCHSFPIDDTSGRTAGQVAANARRLKARRGIGLVVVDYLQLLDGDDSRASRQEQVAGISKRLKALARELKLPVIALSQINRGVENREDHRPRMADLRESGAIEQDADAIILLHRPEYYDPDDQPGIAEAIVAKNRNGPTGTVKLVFHRQLARFDGMARDDF